MNDHETSLTLLPPLGKPAKIWWTGLPEGARITVKQWLEVHPPPKNWNRLGWLATDWAYVCLVALKGNDD